MAGRQPHPIAITLRLDDSLVKQASVHIRQTIINELKRLNSEFSIRNIVALHRFEYTRARILLFEALHQPMVKVDCAVGTDVYTHEANLNFAYVLCASEIGDLRTAPQMPPALTSSMKDYNKFIEAASRPSFDTKANKDLFHDIARLVRR